MRDEEPEFIWSVVALLMVLFCLLFFGSCKTVKEIPVEVVKERVEYIDHIQYDSIYKRDSIYIQDKGDTLIVYKNKYIYKYQFIHDTTFINVTDSIPYVVEVEKQLSKFEQFKMKFATVGIPVVLILICCAVTYIIKK